MDGDLTHELGDLSGLAEADMRCFDDIGTYGVVVARIDGELVAFDDNCPGCDQPLGSGQLTADQIICTQHDAGFDVRDGAASTSTPALPVHRLDGPEHAVRVHLS